MELEVAVVLVVATWTAADLLAFNVNEVFSKKQSPRAKGVGALGLLLGMAVVVVLTFDMIGEASMMMSLQLSLMGGVANLRMAPPDEVGTTKRDASTSQPTQRGENLEAGGFVGSVVPEFRTGLDRIPDTHNLPRVFVKGPRGDGKNTIGARMAQPTASRSNRVECVFWRLRRKRCRMRGT